MSLGEDKELHEIIRTNRSYNADRKKEANAKNISSSGRSPEVSNRL